MSPRGFLAVPRQVLERAPGQEGWARSFTGTIEGPVRTLLEMLIKFPDLHLQRQYILRQHLRCIWAEIEVLAAFVYQIGHHHVLDLFEAFAGILPLLQGSIGALPLSSFFIAGH